MPHLLERYFQKERDVLIGILNYYSKKKIAIWGSGRKCMALLFALGDFASRIDYVYDINPEKHNTVLTTGHRVVSHQEEFSDVIFLSSGNFETEVYHQTKSWKYFPRIINIDHIISGKLTINEVIMEEKRKFVKMRDVSLCALTIVYRPNKESLRNVMSYINGVQYLYIFDNSEENNISLYNDILMGQYKDRVCYHWNKGNNFGLAKPINMIMKKVAGKYDWLITFDQDSRATSHMITAMKKYVESDVCGEDIAIVAPRRVNRPEDMIEEKRVPFISFVNDTIQSGAMHNLSILQKLGGYDEKIFIDFLDLEYCARCIVNGYRIVQVNKARLLHEILDDSRVLKNVCGRIYTIGKYSPERYYYRHRNALYCKMKYQDIHPFFVNICEDFFQDEEILMKYDNNREENVKAIGLAEYDYVVGKMGKLEHLI